MSDGAFEERASCRGRKSKNRLKQLRRLCRVYGMERRRNDYRGSMDNYYVEDLSIDSMKKNLNRNFGRL
ncbi:MAG: hypothetical protein OCU16_03540 [Candidatus Methanospirare jalkutatii]|nr:hypothetical protein [Candidatus Methanoxibalbensis ujae]MCW7080152.1 hypothetical protein [Candidatus Methanospirare jalkutatii]